MKETIEQKNKINLLIFLSTGLFVLTGFVNILSWVLFLLPIGMAFYVFDYKQGGIYQRSIKPIFLDYCVGLICLIEVVSCLNSIYIPNSITTTLQTLLLALFYFFIRIFIRFQSQFILINISISCLSGMLSVVTLIFFLVHRNSFYNVGFNDLTNFKQYYQPLGHLSNDWATILLCFFPSILIAVFNTQGRWRYFFLFVGILNLVALLSSFSRGTYLATFVFFCLSLFGIVFFGKGEGKKQIILISALVLSSFMIVYPERKAVLTTCSMTKTESQKRSLQGRFVKWKEAIHLFMLFPATGVGGGNYALASDLYPQERQGLFTARSTNTYLQILTEKGLLGVLAYGLFLCSILFMGIKKLYNEKGDINLVIVLSALIALLIRELTFSSLFEKDILLVLSILLILNIVQPVQKKQYALFETI